MILMCDHSVAR